MTNEVNDRHKEILEIEILRRTARDESVWREIVFETKCDGYY